MRRNQSEFIKIQPFIQTLRASVNAPKDNFIESIYTNQIQPQKQGLKFNQRQKSISKSKIIKISRKISISNLRQIQKNIPSCFYSNNQLQINFNKICSDPTSSKQIKNSINSFENQQFIQIKDIKITIVLVSKNDLKFKQKSIFAPQKSKKAQQIQTKLDITCLSLSIQDQSKVKRIFDLNLFQKLNKKQYLKIQISEDFKVQSLIVNGRIVMVKDCFQLASRQSEKICQLKPWDLINQRKIWLQNKILSQRPKSKIKWSMSLSESTDKFETLQSKNDRISEIEQNYGLKASQQVNIKYSLELKSKSSLNLIKQKCESEFVNVFSSPQKQTGETISMKSTLESQNNSCPKQQFILLNQPKRRNNMISSLNFNQHQNKILNFRQAVQGNGQRSLRPKSSFKNLKEKNDYFQMKQSERKKSIKKNVDIMIIKDLQKTSKKLVIQKSSEIKQEYGII